MNRNQQMKKFYCWIFKKKYPLNIIWPLFKTILFPLLGETHFQQSKSLGILERGEPESSLLDSFEGGERSNIINKTINKNWVKR